MSQRAFASTHVVPPSGMAAYERADPGARVVAQLEPHLEVAVAEQLGAWARIVCSNGWGAWVDGRQLVPRSAAAAPARPASGPATSGLSLQGLSLQGLKLNPSTGGAALIAIGAFLPWVRGSGLKGNAFDLPASVLWSSPTSTSDGPVDIWVLLAVVAIVAVVFSLRPDGAKVTRGAGIAAIAIPALFLVFLLRLASEFDISVTEIVNIGPLVVLSGGVLLTVGKVTR